MCIQALFTIAICWCGGQRSRDDVHFFSIHDFKKCAATRGGYAAAPIIWVLENGLHKHTRLKNGKLLRRSPYPTIDFGLLEGLREWYDILIGGRNAAWDVSYDKENRRPADGARLLLRPLRECQTRRFNLLAPWQNGRQLHELCPPRYSYSTNNYDWGGGCRSPADCQRRYVVNVFAATRLLGHDGTQGRWRGSTQCPSRCVP